MKNKITTIGIIIATIILAGVAVFTAVRLYQLRQESITPVKPTSKPKAQDVCPEPGGCTSLFFRLGATPTPTPRTAPECNSICRTNADCISLSDSREGSTLSLICYFPPAPSAAVDAIATTAPTGYCREASCPTAPDCFCGRVTPTPTPRIGTTPTPSPTTPPGSTPTPTPVPGATYTPTPVPGATNTPTPVPGAATATPAPGEAAQPELPNAGISFPTILGISLGTLLLIGALLLAL